VKRRYKIILMFYMNSVNVESSNFRTLLANKVADAVTTALKPMVLKMNELESRVRALEAERKKE
jgi:hypothetical protein